MFEAINPQKRPITLSFAGVLQKDMLHAMALLTAVTKVRPGWEAYFVIVHRFEKDTAVNLPEEVLTYHGGGLQGLQDHFARVKVALFFDACAVPGQDLPSIAADAGCYVVMDEALAAKSRRLSPHTFAVFHDKEDLLEKIYQPLRSSVTEFIIAADLANRGHVAMASRTWSEIPASCKRAARPLWFEAHLAGLQKERS